jgi:predicted ester cyclase
MKVTIDGDMIAEGDKCASRWTARGTHEGSLFGIGATHKQVVVHGMEIDRVKNGKIAETWQTWDTMSLFQQLGKVPAQAGMASR